MLKTISRNREKLAVAMTSGRYRSFSALAVERFRLSEALITRHASGRTLDVGCGHMLMKDVVLRNAKTYESLDVNPRVPNVTYITDVLQMSGVPKDAFDTILCFEVLEHVADTNRALAQIATVLRPGGKLLVTVPHLSRLHERPHDYYRFTGYGLESVVQRAGLDVIECDSYGGLAAFVSHQMSTALLGLVWHIPGFRQIVYGLNRCLIVESARLVDRLVDRHHIFPLGVGLVARRPVNNGGR